MKQMRASEFERISAIALEEAGLHLPPSKHSFVGSRLLRRLRATRLPDFQSYLALLDNETEESAVERAELISALTTNVTGYFREFHHFERVAAELRTVIPEASAGRTPIRIWSAGCSTGEEPLSIAATCFAAMGAGWHKYVRILATDIDLKVLKKAKDARPDHTACEDLKQGVAQLANNTISDELPPSAELQSAITYMRHNLLDILPTTVPFDIVFCRNVTIYFEQDTQRRVHLNLQNCVAQGGILLLGHSERLLSRLPDFNFLGTTTYRRERSSLTGEAAWH